VETLSFEKFGFIGLLKINRPKALNALNDMVLTELNGLLNSIEQDQELRVLILTGEGEKAFVAGADIKEIDGLNKSSAQKFAQKGQDVFRRFETLRIPVIAAVNGFALGGGLELAMACDFIYASENAKFGLPEVTLGIMPGFGGAVRLSRYVGLNRAREMTYTGQMLSAQEALSVGLVNKVVPLVELLDEAKKTATLISERAPLGVAQVKKSINKSYDESIDAGMNIEREAFASLFGSKDQIEGTKAFIEKRKPAFVGK
jgi:enoyl-CoA hydratase